MCDCACVRVGPEEPVRLFLCYNYRIAGKFGEDFNLAVWRIVKKSPN